VNLQHIERGHFRNTAHCLCLTRPGNCDQADHRGKVHVLFRNRLQIQHKGTKMICDQADHKTTLLCNSLPPGGRLLQVACITVYPQGVDRYTKVWFRARASGLGGHGSRDWESRVQGMDIHIGSSGLGGPGSRDWGNRQRMLGEPLGGTFLHQLRPLNGPYIGV
jgi:hypothetical protein